MGKIGIMDNLGNIEKNENLPQKEPQDIKTQIYTTEQFAEIFARNLGFFEGNVDKAIEKKRKM